MRREIQKRVFMPSRKVALAASLKSCPFYDSGTGCEFDIDEDEECRYFEGKPIPESCPMKTGSVTLIYYVEE